MIAICSNEVGTLNRHLVVNGIVTDVIVGGGLYHRMAYDKEMDYTFIYGDIVDGKIVTYNKPVWSGEIVTILPVPDEEMLYAEGGVDAEEIGSSDACRIIMIMPGYSKSVVLRHDELMATRYDLEVSMKTYGLFEELMLA